MHCFGAVQIVQFVSDDTDDFGFVAYDTDNNRIIVAYRGTKLTKLEVHCHFLHLSHELFLILLNRIGLLI